MKPNTSNDEHEQIACKCCGKKYNKQTANCCWKFCDCGKEICLNCGGFNIGDDGEDETSDNWNDDDNYWCHKMCKDCNQIGCGMCV